MMGEIIEIKGAVQLTKRKWFHLYKRGWHKHRDFWGKGGGSGIIGKRKNLSTSIV